MKRGPTSGWTAGYINQFEASVHLNEIMKPGEVWDAWLVASNGHTSIQQPFCKLGDSGAWVYNEQGEWLVQIWGEMV
jgi:hypothetical protein